MIARYALCILMKHACCTAVWCKVNKKTLNLKKKKKNHFSPLNEQHLKSVSATVCEKIITSSCL